MDPSRQLFAIVVASPVSCFEYILKIDFACGWISFVPDPQQALKTCRNNLLSRKISCTRLCKTILA